MFLPCLWQWGWVVPHLLLHPPPLHRQAHVLHGAGPRAVHPARPCCHLEHVSLGQGHWYCPVHRLHHRRHLLQCHHGLLPLLHLLLIHYHSALELLCHRGNGWGVDGDIVSNEFCFAHSNTDTDTAGTQTPTWSCIGDVNNTNKRCQSSSQQFFDRAVRGIDLAFTAKSAEAVEGSEVPVGLSNFTYALTDPGNIGEIKWDITLCLLLSWVVCFGCLVKGIKSSGKVVYFTATFPYVLLIAITAYGLTLDGAMDGVRELFVPKTWSGPKSIQDPQVWRKAAEQMFYSLSVSWGGLVMFGSYNKFGHKVHITAATISSLDFLPSIISGLAVFSILGNLAYQQKVPVADVVAGGPGLAFITFPEALAQLPLPQLWAVMFFFMLYLLGLDSEFALIETVLTSFYDFF